MVKYSQLDPQKSEIRLATLLPGKPGDAIQCTLSTASLDSNPDFTALSYVWGDPSVTKPITVDGEPFDATVNLEECLRAIRKRWKRYVLWIDAICINQKDIDEKNIQVPQMGRLYSTAPKVLAWLGPSNPNIDLFVSWMRTYATNSPNAPSPHWLKLDGKAVFSKDAQRERDWALIQAQEGCYDFEALSYWGRTWTFQEYLLSRTEPVFLCGNIMKPSKVSSMLEKSDIENLQKLEQEATERLQAGYEKTGNEEGLALLAQSDDIMTTKFDSLISRPLSVLPILRNEPAGNLARLLYFTSNRQCINERDRIYALYGLVPHAQDIYPPDYSKPISEVMLEAAAYLVNIEHSTCFLWSRFGLRHERLSDSCLHPSWMPDFSISTNGLSRHIVQGLQGGLAIPLKREEDVNRPAFVTVQDATLRFEARRLGTCRVVVRFADAIPDILEQINGLLQMHVLEDRLGKTIRKPETLIPRMARLCVAHWAATPKHSTKDILETIPLLVKSGFDSLTGTSLEKCRNFIYFVVAELPGRVLLATEDSCFGISVSGAEDGDIVVIPPEVEVPLVLRPDSSTSADEVKYYKMVGTIIMDGVMTKEELFDEEFVEEIAKRDAEEFLVR